MQTADSSQRSAALHAAAWLRCILRAIVCCMQVIVCILMGGGRALGEGPSWTMVSEEIFIF